MRASTTRTLQTAFLALLILGLIALALGGYLSPFTRLALTPVLSAQTWLATRFQAVRSLLSQPQDVTRLRQENADLQAEVSRLQAEIIDLKQQLSETQVLSALVDFARVHPENRYASASVIGRDPSPFVKYVIINRGSDQGIRRGMPVVTDKGLAGRIVAVTAGASRVQLITDPASSVNVRIDPSAPQAMLLGSLIGDLTVDMIPQSAEVLPGQLVLTSGLGGNYPANLLVGQVTGVRRKETDLFQTASTQPVVDFSRLEIVMIITNFRPVDITPLVPTPGAPAAAP
jgi:rod shape-determining protein MreC